ncbi:MAG: hypothetical protein ACO31I_18915 [Prochlorotrichaceae cyanobacterium]|jgi:hypothetical protein
MTTTELQDYLSQRLAQLSPDFLKIVVEFVDFLLQKQEKDLENLVINPEELGWSSGFFEKTYGVWQGEPLTRGDQGSLVEREPLL